MKHIYLTLLALSISLAGFAQSEVTSVCGIPYGTSKERALHVLWSCFGYDHVSDFGPYNEKDEI